MVLKNTNCRENETEAKKLEIDSQTAAPLSDLDLPPLHTIFQEQDSNLPQLPPNLEALYRAATALPSDLQKLYSAAMDGNWEVAKAITDKDPSAKTKRISLLGLTALHVAASCGRSGFVVELAKLLTKQELEIRDKLGRTALHHVALAASVRAAKTMVEKNPNLPLLGDMAHQTPILYAAQWRHGSKTKEMLEYLYRVTKDKPPCLAFTGSSASNLIVAITASGSYDIALRILFKNSELAHKKNDKGMSILHVLAMQPSAFRSRNKLSLWNLLTYQRMRKASEIKRSHHLNAVKLVEFVCEELQEKSITVIHDFFIPKNDTAILHLAIDHGVFELVQICLRHFPDLIWYVDNRKRILLHAAIEHHRELYSHHGCRLLPCHHFH